MRVVPQTITRDQARDTGMALVLLCLLLAQLWTVRWMLPAAIILHVVNMIEPRVFRPAAFVWLGLSRVIGTVLSSLLLCLVFFVVVTPIGLTLRLARKDSLSLQRWKRGGGSVFIGRDHPFDAHDLENPY